MSGLSMSSIGKDHGFDIITHPIKFGEVTFLLVQEIREVHLKVFIIINLQII